ncbi:hypothetical protein [Streptacidiphilus sp. P02-A3a]|uniref:hypothetical protein n=1 Tax=Streptacidiphilus sp. P02-A3a TaxID=2704468 RepID=UPI0015F81183|nr:hypothetical protein [Streptacidiphilus sp. P02-A3a]QMU68874.1 hypothetical protein GXP74_12170 [Streptacidiphilus sp. P02-A3a]
MKTVKNQLDTLADRSLAHPEVVIAASAYYKVTARARAAREEGEKGAVSIEQAIITVAVIAFALLIMAGIATVVHNLSGQIKNNPDPVVTVK